MGPAPVDPGTVPEHEPIDPVPVHPVTTQDPQDTPGEAMGQPGPKSFRRTPGLPGSPRTSAFLCCSTGAKL